MASGSTAMWRRGCPNHAPLDVTCSCQTSAEHFQECAEFPLLRNRRFGPLPVTYCHSARQQGRRYRWRRAVQTTASFVAGDRQYFPSFAAAHPFIHKLTVKVS